ncbi:MAG: CHAT domain-containing protein [Nitrospiraceae bacterium]
MAGRSPIDDGTRGEFYRQLQTAGVGKAVALQRAQQKILSQPGHEHPGFWAPLLLINDWR